MLLPVSCMNCIPRFWFQRSAPSLLAGYAAPLSTSGILGHKFPPVYRQALVYFQAFGALTASGFQVLNFLVIAEIKLKPLRLHCGIHTFWRLPRLGDSKASENPS